MNEDEVSDYIPDTDISTDTDEYEEEYEEFSKKMEKKISANAIRIQEERPELARNEILNSYSLQSSTMASVLHTMEQEDGKVLGVDKHSKRNSCYFCGKLVTKVSRHMIGTHSTENKIVQIITKGKEEKDRSLKELRLLGNYRYNMSCLEKGRGNLIVMRAPARDCNALSFLPCPYCFGFVHQKELHKHCRTNCMFRLDHVRERNPVQEAKVLAIPNKRYHGTDNLSRLVLDKLRHGIVRNKIINDPLILAFANSQLNRLRAAKGEKFNFLCQRLRNLGRLLVQCEDTCGSSKSLLDLIKPCNFDLLINCVQNLTVGEEKPKSLGLKLGHALRKCAVVAKCLAIKAKNEETKLQAEEFLQLMDGEWNDFVSSSLLRELYDMKLNKDIVLPITSDLVKLNKHLNDSLAKAMEIMLAQPSESSYFKLLKVVLCKIVLFNKRRGGEAAQISVSNFVNRPSWSSQKNEDIAKSFTKLEAKLAEKLDLIKVSGKRGRHVPILLTPDIVKAMNLLVEERCHVNIKATNTYFFANTGDKYIRGCDVLHSFVASAGVSNPAAITSTNLRKYIATVSQVISLEKEELEWLADHLGHSIEVHRDFYRLQESTLEICKVSKLLMAVEQGSIHRLVGKKLSDITIEHCFPHEESTSTQSDDAIFSIDYDVSEELDNGIENKDASATLDSMDTDETSENMATSATSENMATKATSENMATNTALERNSNKCKQKPEVLRKSWKKDVKNQAFKYFKRFLVAGRVPKKMDCEAFLEKYEIADRKWRDIKNLIYNEIKKKK